ncbi:MAG TPA: 2'-5' RNA ligase family protein [Nocardioidaceae bacterium]|nr:2'-5' RNA ligase family protein [Nocardioidaceae bacterium]
MGSTSILAATAEELRDHWVWRPEWTTRRTCLYWYLTFGEDQITHAVGEETLRRVRGVGWLDAVPPAWCHVTVADVGFADELEPTDVERVTEAVADAVAGQDRLRLILGPAQTFPSALVLAVGPLDRLRAVKARVRRSTSAVLGARHTDVHRRLFWPHLSLGYVNRPVDARTAARLLDALPAVSARLDVAALTLAAVTRRDHSYRWRVQAQVDLLGNVTRTPG